MDLQSFVASLERSLHALDAAFAGVSSAEAVWRPAPERWSPVEIACHLLDEEREDFRPRIASTLEDPARPWAPIDPQGAARTRGYRTRDLTRTLAELRRERDASLAWLRGQAGADWTKTHVHPKLGPLSAGDLLAAWATHDLLHMQQVARTRAAYLSSIAAPFSTRYALP